jgi:hypothetical protein
MSLRAGLVLVALLLGLLTGVAAIVVHQWALGLLLAAVASVTAVRALRAWVPAASLAFAAGWLTPLIVGLKGRGEGDYVVSSALSGHLLIGLGLVILVTGLVSGLVPVRRRDSGSGATPT